jgi:hypothetical protein
MVLNAIYEGDFVDFSYGFRPGRGPHYFWASRELNRIIRELIRLISEPRDLAVISISGARLAAVLPATKR